MHKQKLNVNLDFTKQQRKSSSPGKDTDVEGSDYDIAIAKSSHVKHKTRTAKFEAYFKKLENTKVVLELQLALKVDDSKSEKDQFLKEINHLRAELENLKGKFMETKFDKPLILRKPPADKL
ncbi:hypothetical protein Tco_1440765 [Tanacetum coccineum]